MPNVKSRTKPISEIPVKKRIFAEEYAICFDPTSAAKKAGYKSPSAMGSKLLKDPSVVNYLRRFINRVTDRNELRLEEVIEQLRACITRDIGDYVGEDGKIITDANRLSTRARRAVDGIKQEVTIMYADGDAIGEKIKTELKLVPKASAIDMGLKYLDAYPRDGKDKNLEKDKRPPLDWDSLVQAAKNNRGLDQMEDPVEVAYKHLESLPDVEPKEKVIIETNGHQVEE